MKILKMRTVNAWVVNRKKQKTVLVLSRILEMQLYWVSINANQIFLANPDQRSAYEQLFNNK